MIRGSWCSKSRLAKAVDAEVAQNLKNGTLWPKTHFQVKIHKTPHSRTNFWSSEVEKWHAAVARSTFASQYTKHHMRGPSSDVQEWHAAVARSTFASQKVQNTSGSQRFLKFRSGKMARRCGAKHLCKSKCTKHHRLGPLFELQMSGQC